ncbi:hypothetical protein HKD21_00130 [Gluconobacter cerevisiae]|uniref:Secretin/TonB short N-terminal domain-containing protein n=1 Tax=Gluconobacter cerevisiae TaxID=1379734 RepID=A0ABR9Y9D3_9PROT|nr:hypothetical protein [Gluconobacter cerevisiae]MBF0875258.1 hypothetical protein [Gluconobacter cerevisiae]
MRDRPYPERFKWRRLASGSVRMGLRVLVCVCILGMSVSGKTVTRTPDICPVRKAVLQIDTKALGVAVAELERKTQCPVLMDDALLQDGSSVPVRGFYTPRDALVRLLGNAELDVIETVQGLTVMPLTYREAHRMDRASRL